MDSVTEGKSMRFIGILLAALLLFGGCAEQSIKEAMHHCLKKLK